MDTGQTLEQQLLSHAERQTRAVESIRLVVVTWSYVAAAAVGIWLVALLFTDVLA
jgi:hypothetical protein